jgi:hypothetical protein
MKDESAGLGGPTAGASQDFQGLTASITSAVAGCETMSAVGQLDGGAR